MQTITAADIAGMEKIARVQFVTSLPGVKPICLIGTTDFDNNNNLAPFSSVVHLGSEPALLGIVSRPDLVERHSLANIIQMGAWTINHLHPEILIAAHQCSARYAKHQSEFEATGLSCHFEPGFIAPFVAESRFRIGLTLEDIIPIPTNGTKIIVGRVVMVQVVANAINPHGSLDLVEIECVASTALDTYFRIQPHLRLGHACLDEPSKKI
jgi:flavin reductase (DIM6/NTAB) family NADH-FMN oxidoreductase RutF